MLSKIKYFLNSNFFKKTLKFVYNCFMWLIFIAFIFSFILNCIYFALVLYDTLPTPTDITNVFSKLIFN